MSVEDNLSKAGIVLPTPATPVATYVPYSRAGSLVYISGQLSVDSSGGIKGIVGDDVPLATAKSAARICGINLIAQIKSACGNDFQRLKSIVKLGGFVQAGNEFFDVPTVINGCSDLMVEIFEDRGKHARSAVGVYRLPFGFAVEVDAIIECH